jgi:FkbM family methyltransferase
MNPGPLDHLDKYRIECDSVLHIGGHFAEEAEIYSQQNISKVVFIEGDPEIFARMMKRLTNFPGQDGICALLSDSEGPVDFYFASNEGASSSILKPGRHLTHKPKITFEEVRQLQSCTLDSLDLGKFDLIVIDVQGAETRVIAGGLETISKAKALWVEVNVGSMYEGDFNSSEVVNVLREHFVPVYMNMGVQYWGDALFVNKSLTL